MKQKRVFTDDVLTRVLKLDKELSHWMRSNNISEIDPEGCMDLLCKKNIYAYDWNGKGHYFREDLRTLRDTNNLNVFKQLIIEQQKPNAPWKIKLKIV